MSDTWKRRSSCPPHSGAPVLSRRGSRPQSRCAYPFSGLRFQAPEPGISPGARTRQVPSPDHPVGLPPLISDHTMFLRGTCRPHRVPSAPQLPLKVQRPQKASKLPLRAPPPSVRSDPTLHGYTAGSSVHPLRTVRRGSS